MIVYEKSDFYKIDDLENPFTRSLYIVEYIVHTDTYYDIWFLKTVQRNNIIT